MRLYKTTYTNRNGSPVSDVFFVMDTDERDVLGDMVEILIEDVAKGRKDKTIKRWNDYDEQTIVFLKRMTNYGTFDESECMDANTGQVFKFIEKTLNKTYGPTVNFERWLGLSIDDSRQQGWLTSSEMKEIMDERRKLKALFDKRDKVIKAIDQRHNDLRFAYLKEPK